MRCLLAGLALLSLCAPAPLWAADALERLEIRQRADAFGGAAFGTVGPYEQIVATAYLRADPGQAGNRGIADLDKAARGADGQVHYSVDVVILRPKDAGKAAPVLVYDVVNRGHRLLLGANDATASEPAGNGFLMRQGYTLVWSGWQADLPDSPGLLRARLPVAADGDRPITGGTEQEAVFDSPGTRSPIALPYPAANLDTSALRVTVRARPDAPARDLPASAWQFTSDHEIQVDRPADMDAGAIYQVTYTARDPVVAGLGFAATRDLVAFLRHDRTAANPLADIRVGAAIGIGASQSGRYLRDFLWQGFNRDLDGRPVFDGLVPLIAGARKTWTNLRWAQPGRFSRQHEDHLVPGNRFPFAYATLADPAGGEADGILKRCTADGTCPKLFHVDTSAEFWQAGSSRIATDSAGRDLPLPPNVRAYLIAGGTHVPGMVPPFCTGAANSIGTGLLQRALLVAMADWIAGRAEPPASRWPTVADGTLVPPSRQAVAFPDLSGLGIAFPARANDGGTPAWPVLVPKVDADGNDLGGVRVPEVAVPRGTYLGWSLRKPGFAEGDLCNLFGSFVPFAADAAQRTAGDPRAPLAERYPVPSERAARLRAAAEALRRDRLLLDEDVQRLAAQP